MGDGKCRCPPPAGELQPSAAGTHVCDPVGPIKLP
jgi:hypothetical protein